MKDIQRTFMYHGAEHKCINCVEHGLDLNVENVKKSSRFHKRCGTSFLFLVVFISILFFVAVLSLLVYDLFYLLRSGRKWRRMGVAYLASLAGFLVFSVFEFSLQTPKELQYFMLFLGLVEASKRLCQKSMAEQNIPPKPLEETPPAVKEESPASSGSI